jgi:hypothetical protein
MFFKHPMMRPENTKLLYREAGHHRYGALMNIIWKDESEIVRKKYESAVNAGVTHINLKSSKYVGFLGRF